METVGENNSGMAAAESNIAPYIRTLRGQRVILDHDLAALYGVPTKQFNQAFKRNRSRFPDEFAFQLLPEELPAMNWSQSAASTSQDIADYSLEGALDSRARTRKHRGATYRPWAFTEHGALMAANILRSPRAREMSVFSIRAFVRMREELVAHSAILTRLAEIDRTLLVHDAALRELYEKLLPLLEPPAETPKPRIGFHPGNR
ncbi:MAG: ORF6N domain-containing protein [Opitutaceae bacterium]|nr:ORF6N domain-containing protein [Opitutaceae bacterium]